MNHSLQNYVLKFQIICILLDVKRISFQNVHYFLLMHSIHFETSFKDAAQLPFKLEGTYEACMNLEIMEQGTLAYLEMIQKYDDYRFALCEK